MRRQWTVNLARAGPVGSFAVDLDDVDLGRPRLVVGLAPEGRPGAVAAGGADPGLPVAVLLGELVLGVDAADAEGLAALRPRSIRWVRTPPLTMLLAGVAPAVVAAGRLTPAEPVRPLGPLSSDRPSKSSEKVSTQSGGDRRPGRDRSLLCGERERPAGSSCPAGRSVRFGVPEVRAHAPPGAGGPGGVPRGGRDGRSCDEQHQREGQCRRRPMPESTSPSRGAW